jgi:transposase
MDLTKEQWELVAPLLPVAEARRRARGRPWSDQRKVFSGVLWILRAGAPWKDLPPRSGVYQTVHRRFQNWVRAGTLEKILLALAAHLHAAGGLDLKECFVDGTFVPAKKGGGWWDSPNVAKARKSWVWPPAMVFRSPCGQKALRQRK